MARTSISPMELVSYGPIGTRNNVPVYILTTYISKVLNVRTSVGRFTAAIGTDS